MTQDKSNDRDSKKNDDFSGASSVSGTGTQAGTLSADRERAQASSSAPGPSFGGSSSRPGQSRQESESPGGERRPRYGNFYASAVQRISTRRGPPEEQAGWAGQSGFGRQGESGSRGGYGQSQGGQGGYAQGQSGAFGSQHYEEQSRGTQDRERSGGERPRPSGGKGDIDVEHGVEHGGFGQGEREGSRFERGSFGGGRSQATGGLRDYGDYGSRFGAYGSSAGGPGVEHAESHGWSGRDFESGREIGAYGQDPQARGYGLGEGRFGTFGERDREGAFGRERGTRERERDTEGRRSRWQREPFTAGEIMTRDIKAVTKQSTLQNVAEVMKDENCGIVPIVDESHKLLGVVTDRDLVIRTLAEGKTPSEVKVEDVMTEDLEVVTADEELKEVVELMGKKQVRRIPVVDRDDRLVGIIAMADIANRADYDEDLQDALERISSRRSFWNRLWS